MSFFAIFAFKRKKRSEMKELSYRPHDPGHDYYEPGIYLITLVVRNRQLQPKLLGALNKNLSSPGVILTPVGEAVMEEWQKTPSIQASKGNKITILKQVVMPDHWHGVIQVHERMNRSLGHIMQYVKSSCTARWHELTGTQIDSSSSQAIRSMSEKQRQEYYSSLPTIYQPLWDDNYDDTICINEEHLQRMMHYVDDNPRRAIGRYWKPEGRRFDACSQGSLLILAPWHTEGTSDYAIFHNMNTLAEEICRFEGEARIVGKA